MKSSYDVLVIGGGAAGIMAALSVRHHHPEKTVAILEKSFEVGRKLLVSGAGRCNITNTHYLEDLSLYFHGDASFITSVVAQFGYRDIIHFFADLGVPTYEEKKTGLGKIFPVIDHAKTVRDMLIDSLIEHQVVVVCDTVVQGIHTGKPWRITTNKGIFEANTVIFTTGGQTYPSLGSDGSGYELVASVGHTLISPVVSAVPLVSKNMLSHYLQGEKATIRMTPIINGTPQRDVVGELMFTQYGFSGPAALDASHDISIAINRHHESHVQCILSFLPNVQPEEAEKMLRERLIKHSHLPVAHCLWGLLTEKIAGAVCAVSNLPKDLLCQDISEEQIRRLVQQMTNYLVDITGTRGWNEGEFTAGGVATNEVKKTTLESKIQAGLYFAGEILDVDGMVGGFNLSWAWSSGWVAGRLQ